MKKYGNLKITLRLKELAESLPAVVELLLRNMQGLSYDGNSGLEIGSVTTPCKAYFCGTLPLSFLRGKASTSAPVEEAVIAVS